MKKRYLNQPQKAHSTFARPFVFYERATVGSNDNIEKLCGVRLDAHRIFTCNESSTSEPVSPHQVLNCKKAEIPYDTVTTRSTTAVYGRKRKRWRISNIPNVLQNCVASLPSLHDLSTVPKQISYSYDSNDKLASYYMPKSSQQMGGVCSCVRLADSKIKLRNGSRDGSPVSRFMLKRNTVWTSLQRQIRRDRPMSIQPIADQNPLLQGSKTPQSCCEKEADERLFCCEPIEQKLTETKPEKDLLNEVEDENGDFVTFRLCVRLRCGRGLVIRDASGSSDPYVKVKYRNKTIYKSNTIYRNLNPNWDEEFAFLIEDPTFSLHFEVFDFDRFLADDFMGSASVDLSLLKLFENHDVTLNLEEEGNPEDMGQIDCSITVTPLTERQKAQFLSRAVRGVISVTPKRTNKTYSVWLSTVNVVLVEARLGAETVEAAEFDAVKPVSGTPPDVYVKFKLGNEKHKSKVCSRNFSPKWSEQFDLHVFEETVPPLNLMVYDKTTNSIIGSCSISFKDREKERTYEEWHTLEDGEDTVGRILLLTTVSGTSVSPAATVLDLEKYSSNRDKIVDKYSLRNSFYSLKDVGYLTVKVYRAEGLAAGDVNGKSDPFCVLELVNMRLHTHTVYKTLDPDWNKLFTLAVKDIHEVLEVTVYDEDPNKKFEFLGKIAIPLLKIRNCEKRWYALRDRKLGAPAKGRILMELDLLWNPVKAALRTFQPRERKFVAPEPKFKRQLLIGAANRLKEFGQQLLTVRDFYQSCLSWQSYQRSSLAFLAFVLFVYFVELWHVPLLLLFIFLRCYLKRQKVKKYVKNTMPNSFASGSFTVTNSTFYSNEDPDEEDELTRDTSDEQRKTKSAPTTPSKATVFPPMAEKSSIRSRVLVVQETLTLVQGALEFVVSLLERVKNTFNFTVPFLSGLAIIVLCIATVILFFVPFRWIVMAWGVNKFTKLLRNPHYVDNNELLDFLSRVPSDGEFQILHRELHRNSVVDSKTGENGIINSSHYRNEENSSSLKKKTQ